MEGDILAICENASSAVIPIAFNVQRQDIDYRAGHEDYDFWVCLKQYHYQQVCRRASRQEGDGVVSKLRGSSSSYVLQNVASQELWRCGDEHDYRNTAMSELFHDRTQSRCLDNIILTTASLIRGQGSSWRFYAEDIASITRLHRGEESEDKQDTGHINATEMIGTKPGQPSPHMCIYLASSPRSRAQ